MAVHHLQLPVDKDAVLALAVGDVVFLSGEITATGGLPAHKRIREFLAEGRELPVRHTGTFVHLPTMMEEADGVYEVLYVNPTTSTRFNGFIPGFIRELDLRIVAGKGGLDTASLEAMRETGCVYLSLLGGGSPILTAAIREVAQVAWLDFPSHFRLMTLRVENLGPLTVGMDAHGGSTYARLSEEAEARVPRILEDLTTARQAFEAAAAFNAARPDPSQDAPVTTAPDIA
jgi:fumarate hydratase subunit beta